MQNKTVEWNPVTSEELAGLHIRTENAVSQVRIVCDYLENIEGADDLEREMLKNASNVMYALEEYMSITKEMCKEFINRKQQYEDIGGAE